MRVIINNTISLMASDVISRITSFVIYILVGRFLGTFAFGQMSLALSMFYTFQVFAVAGLKVLIVREVAKDPASSEKYFVNGNFIVFISSLLSLAILYIFVHLMGYHQQYEQQLYNGTYLPASMSHPTTATVILLVCLSLLPYAFSRVCEAIFQGLQRMALIAYVNVPINILRIVLIIMLLSNNYGLFSVALVLLISHIIGMLTMWVLLFASVVRPRLQLDFPFIRSTFHKSRTFLTIDALTAVTASVHLVLLSYFIDETATGLYSSATQLITPLIVLSQSIIISVFPILCQRFDQNNIGDLKRIVSNLMEILLFFMLPSIIFIFYYADWGLTFVYGEVEFAAAANALRIMSFVVIVRAMTSVLGSVLLATLHEKITLQIVVAELLLNLFLGAVLIRFYGIDGAVVASLIAIIIIFLQHLLPVLRIINGIPFLQISWKVGLASTLTTVILYFTQELSPFLSGILLSCVYLTILGVLVLVHYRSLKGIRLHYLGSA